MFKFPLSILDSNDDLTQVVQMSVNVINSSPLWDYSEPDHQATQMTCKIYFFCC